MRADMMRRRRALVADLERKLRELEVVEQSESVVRARFEAMLIEQLSDAAAELRTAEHQLESARAARSGDPRDAERQIRTVMAEIRAILYHCGEHTRRTREQGNVYRVRRQQLHQRLIRTRAMMRFARVLFGRGRKRTV